MDYLNRYHTLARDLISSSGLSGKLPRNAIGSVIVRVAAVVLAFFVNVVLARSLGISEYGLFIYASGWLNILLIPACLGFDQLSVRQIAIYLSNTEWGKLKGIYQFAMSNTLRASIIIGLLMFGTIYIALGSQNIALVFYFTALLIPIGAIIRLQQGVLRGLHLISLGQIPEFIVQPFLLLLLLLVIFYGVKQVLTASEVMALNIIAAITALLTGSQLLTRAIPLESNKTDPVFDRKNWVSSLIPFMLIGGIFILNEQIATVLLGLLSSTRQVAVFTAAEKWAGITIFMLQALNLGLAPIFASLYAIGDREQLQKIVTLSSQIITLFAFIPLLAFLIVPQLFLSAFGNDFSGGQIPLIILGIGQFINAFTGSVGFLLSMTGHERTLVGCSLLGIAVNLLLGILLIPSMEVIGAAIATATSIIITNVALSIFVIRRLKIFPTALGPMIAKYSFNLV